MAKQQISEFQADRIKELSKLLSLVPSFRMGFASDLVSKGGKYKLSEKQMYWVDRIIGEALTGVTETKPEVEKVNLGIDFAKIVALFETAASNLKYPKITFGYHDFKLVMARAGSKSRYPGCINLTDGGPYGANTWYGRINVDGTYTPNQNLDNVAKGKVRDILSSLAENPAKAAAEYGHKTGNCCFCHRSLSQENSVAAGFGPICAANYGLTKEWQDAPKLQAPAPEYTEADEEAHIENEAIMAEENAALFGAYQS